MGHQLTELEFVVGEAVLLPSEDEGALPAFRQADQPFGGVLGTEHHVEVLPRPVRGAHGQGHALQGLIQGGALRSPVEYVACAHGHLSGVPAPVIRGVHEIEPGKGRVLHRTGHGSDVSRLLRLHQNNADPAQELLLFGSHDHTENSLAD